MFSVVKNESGFIGNLNQLYFAHILFRTNFTNMVKIFYAGMFL